LERSSHPSDPLFPLPSPAQGPPPSNVQFLPLSSRRRSRVICPLENDTFVFVPSPPNVSVAKLLWEFPPSCPCQLGKILLLRFWVSLFRFQGLRSTFHLDNHSLLFSSPLFSFDFLFAVQKLTCSDTQRFLRCCRSCPRTAFRSRRPLFLSSSAANLRSCPVKLRSHIQPFFQPPPMKHSFTDTGTPLFPLTSESQPAFFLGASFFYALLPPGFVHPFPPLSSSLKFPFCLVPGARPTVSFQAKRVHFVLFAPSTLLHPTHEPWPFPAGPTGFFLRARELSNTFCPPCPFSDIVTCPVSPLPQVNPSTLRPRCELIRK